MINATSATMANATTSPDLPPLPAYTLRPMPDLVPIVLYWALSMVFHFIDVYDIWPQYRLHTPDEILKRNHATRYEVARDVIIQQIIQTATGYLLGYTEPRQMIGKDVYDVAVWATRIRLAQRALPPVLGLLGLNAASISKNMLPSHPLLAGVLAGGYYPGLMMELDGSNGLMVPAFATWEIAVAKAIYWLVIPALQLFGAVVILDTWEYFIHRLMHVNKWLYSESMPPCPRP
jgi:sphinganine C4-monooxygenase